MDERRYFGLDALRGFMMMLGIVLHGSMLYMATPPAAMPIPTDPNTSRVFDVAFHFIHAFRMPTFFVLAGFFASLLVEKRGIWGTLWNRGARVLAPLLAGAVTILPLAGILMLDAMLAMRFGTHELWPDRAEALKLGKELKDAGVPVEQPALMHLWFLYYLCYFYLLLPVWRILAERSLAMEAAIRRLLASPAGFVLLAFVTAATLWPFRGGQVHEGFIFLKPHPPSLAYYGTFFVLGYVFHSHRSVLEVFKRSVAWTGPLGIALFAASLRLAELDDLAVPRDAALHLLATLASSLCTWALIYFFIGGALRFFDRGSPWILYVSQSSYWVFLVHLPVVCFAGWLLVPYDVPAMIKFLGVAGFSAAVCFVTYHYGVQETWISVFLNGRRFDLDWPWRARAKVG